MQGQETIVELLALLLCVCTSELELAYSLNDVWPKLSWPKGLCLGVQLKIHSANSRRVLHLLRCLVLDFHW
jgi:hypothetical protein